MEIFNASSTLTSEAQMCFAKPPTRVVFQASDTLFRFGSIVSQTFKGNDVFGSPWWIPADTYRQITKTAHRTGKSTVDVARSRLAVATAWNPDMDWLMILELRRTVYAWVGPARPQHLAGPRSPMLLGNFNQAYVPDLAPAEALSSEAGVLLYYGSPLA